MRVLQSIRGRSFRANRFGRALSYLNVIEGYTFSWNRSSKLRLVAFIILTLTSFLALRNFEIYYKASLTYMRDEGDVPKVVPGIVQNVLKSVFFFSIFTLIQFLTLRWHARFTAIMLSFYYAYQVFKQDFGMAYQQHGAYNTIAFVVIITPILLIGICLITLFKNVSFRRSITSLFLIILFIGLAVNFSARQVRNTWVDGINHDKLVNNISIDCKVPLPHYNYYSMFPKVDIPKCIPEPILGYIEDDMLIMDNCTELPQWRAYGYTKEDHVNHSTMLYAASTLEGLDIKILEEYGWQNYTDPVPLSEMGPGDHVELKCGFGDPTAIPVQVIRQVLTRLRRNPSAVERATKVANDVKAQYRKSTEKLNIMVVLIDGVSRAHLHRALPETVRTLEDIHKAGDMSLFQFFRYHALGVNTQFNEPFLLTGRAANWTGKGGTSDYTNDPLWRRYEKAGYVTGFNSGLCEDPRDRNEENETWWDHSSERYLCRLEINPSTESLIQGPYSVSRRCTDGTRGINVHEFMLEQISNMWKVYPDLPKFSLNLFYENHEPTLTILPVLDEDLSLFLRDVDMNNSVVLIIADHGPHVTFPVLWAERDAMIENAFPMLNILVPNWFLKKYPDIQPNLHHNQQSLVNHLDVFKTLSELSVFPNEQDFDLKYQGDSHPLNIFTQEVPWSRTCADAGIKSDFCQCNRL